MRTTMRSTSDVLRRLDGLRAVADRLDAAYAAGEVTRAEYDRGHTDWHGQVVGILRDALDACDRRGLEGEWVREGRAVLAEAEAGVR